MTAADLAIVVLTMVGIASLGVVLFAAQSLVRTARELAVVLERVETEVEPAVAELRSAVAEARHDLDRVDRLITTAEAIGDTVEGASRLTYQALSSPVIKTIAVASGTGKAVRRLRGTRAS